MSAMTPVFISFASDNRSQVHTLAAALKLHGITPTLYDELLPAGQSIVEWIDSALTACRYSIIVASDEYFAKQWTLAEYRAIVHRYIADADRPLFVACASPDLSVPPLLRTYRQVSLTDTVRAAEEIAHAISGHEAGTSGGPRRAAASAAPAPLADIGLLGEREIVLIAQVMAEQWFNVRRTNMAAPTFRVKLGGHECSVSLDRGALDDDLLRIELSHQVELAKINAKHVAILGRELERAGLGIFVAAFEIEFEERRSKYSEAVESIREMLGHVIEARVSR